jgi:hypothetical protein
MAGKSSKSKKPTHEAFVVTGKGESAFWTKLGAVWPHDVPYLTLSNAKDASQTRDDGIDQDVLRRV